MDIRQLEAYVYTVKYRSFSLAAQKLYLSQPTVSAHICNLEKELHTQLLKRTTKNALGDTGRSNAVSVRRGDPRSAAQGRSGAVKRTGTMLHIAYRPCPRCICCPSCWRHTTRKHRLSDSAPAARTAWM